MCVCVLRCESKLLCACCMCMFVSVFVLVWVFVYVYADIGFLEGWGQNSRYAWNVQMRAKRANFFLPSPLWTGNQASITLEPVVNFSIYVHWRYNSLMSNIQKTSLKIMIFCGKLLETVEDLFYASRCQANSLCTSK